MQPLTNHNLWAFILGGSSGFGLATAKKLAQHKYNIFIVHRDPRSAMPAIEAEFEKIKQHGNQFISINTNALTEEGETKIIETLKANLGNEQKISLFLHSIAWGNLKYLNPNNQSVLSKEDLDITLYAMGSSFATWSTKLVSLQLFSSNACIVGLTSQGSQIAWEGYAAVGAAKAVLETMCRYLATELAPLGIRTNLINAGVTDTPALRAIPNYQNFIQQSIHKSPFKRLTVPEDVANAIYLLTLPEANWINGTIIRVDGGEQISY